MYIVKNTWERIIFLKERGTPNPVKYSDTTEVIQHFPTKKACDDYTQIMLKERGWKLIFQKILKED